MSKEVIDRIKKLLRNEGRSAEEAESFISAAHRLAATYNIDISSINIDESDRESIEHTSAAALSRLYIECKYSALIAKNFFNVEVILKSGIDKDKFITTFRYTKKYEIIFIGTKTNITIAEYVYNFLVQHFRHEWNTKRGRLKKRQAFMRGMYLGLTSKLREKDLGFKKNQEEGIILSNRIIQEYIKNNFGLVKAIAVKPDSTAAKASLAGYILGRNTNIQKAVRNSQKKSLKG